MGDAHVFRFFVDGALQPGDRRPLRGADVQHARVVRLQSGDDVDVVDGAGRAWRGTWDDDAAEVVINERVSPDGEQREVVPHITVIAGALTGAKFDELVDGVVQAGASAIQPWCRTSRDQARLSSRRARLQRIAHAAAKQAKRTEIPLVQEPIGDTELRARPAGVVLNAAAPQHLLDVCANASAGSADLPLLIGGAEGIEADLVAELVAGGWRDARLVPSVLRAELAAPIAVAATVMYLAR